MTGTRRVRRLVVLAVSSWLAGTGAGCGTIAASQVQPDAVYGGTRIDVECAVTCWTKEPSSWIIFPFCLVDLPLSMVADTVILPYTLKNAIEAPPREEPGPSPEAPSIPSEPSPPPPSPAVIETAAARGP